MEFKWLFYFAMLGSLAWSASAETVIKILHIQKLPKVLEIWKEAAQEFQRVHPGVKVQFDYLENEAFKAKLPTLLQSKDRPSAFHSWGGGVMYEQEIDRSQWIQIAMDQLLGPDTGRVLNDMSADLASGHTTPEKAAKALEASWQQNKN